MDAIIFLINSILLGVGLAMDAFSVSLANGMSQPGMGRGTKIRIAGTFSVFQFLMPVIGWGCVHAAAQTFSAFAHIVPWIALVLLLILGGKMILDAHKTQKARTDTSKKTAEPGNVSSGEAAEPGNVSYTKMAGTAAGGISAGLLLTQGIATSIDALSVGFAIALYEWYKALGSALIIAAVTYLICRLGIALGIRIGTRLEKAAGILGGCILIFIGIEIVIRGM